MDETVSRGKRRKKSMAPHIPPDVLNKREKSPMMVVLRTQLKNSPNLLTSRSHRSSPSTKNHSSTCNLRYKMDCVYSEISVSKAILGIRIVPVGLTVLLRLCFFAFCI